MTIVHRLLSRVRNILLNGDITISRAAQKNKALAFALVHSVKLYDRIFSQGSVANEIEKKTKLYLEGESEAWIKKTIKEIWKCRELYLIDPEEYFLFRFSELSDAEKRQYVGNREKEKLCGKLNKNGACKIFTDKWKSYLKFKPYYRREVIRILDVKDIADFYTFCEKHEKVIIKDSTSSRGKGIYFADNSIEGSAEAAANEIRKIIEKKKEVVVEQKIIQSDIMSAFNPSSVNTLRIATFITDEGIQFLFAFLRFGRKDSFVDNGGSGGLFASVDLETGKCNSLYFDKLGEQFQNHPDTNKPILGFQIPQWEELLALVKELAMVVPEQRYVGWDMAFTDDGWVMIEGNSWAQMGSTQISHHQGLRPVIEKTFGRYIGGSKK